MSDCIEMYLENPIADVRSLEPSPRSRSPIFDLGVAIGTAPPHPKLQLSSHHWGKNSITRSRA